MSWPDKQYPQFGGENVHGYLSADIICSMQDTNRAKLEEKCERETDNVQGQISVRIFAPTRGYCAIIFQIFLQSAWKNIFTNSILFAAWHGFRYDFMNKTMFTFSCNSHKKLSRIEWNFEERLIVMDVRFQNWGISLG